MQKFESWQAYYVSRLNVGVSFLSFCEASFTGCTAHNIAQKGVHDKMHV